MKVLSLLFLTLFVGKGCDSGSKQDINTAVIEYVANTRGFYQKVTLEKQMVTVTNDRNETEKATPVKISDADWKILIEQFDEVNLDELKDLKVPTEKRLYDGAAIANLKVTYKGVTYETPSFDHGTPPYEIKKIVNKINSFAKQNDDN
jgi:starvation-inducible outer membrane lipoprotein